LKLEKEIIFDLNNNKNASKAKEVGNNATSRKSKIF